MRASRIRYLLAAILFACISFCEGVQAMTAKEIVEKAQKSQFGESVRASVQVETFQGRQENISAFSVGHGGSRKR